MSKEKILETISEVKEEFIEEAAPKGVLQQNVKEETSSKNGRITKIYPYLKWGALAACLCIIIGLSMKSNLFSASKEDSAFEAKDQMKPTTESAKHETGADERFNVKEETDYSITDDTNTSISNDTMADTEELTGIPEMTDKGFPDWGLTLSVKNVTASGLTLVVKQSGGNPTGYLQTGEPYRLITLVNGTWKVVEELPLPEGVDGRGFNSLAHNLPKNETREFEINWEWIFGELPAGTYRLIKEFMDFRETANYDTFEYWVEFEIQ